MKIYISLHKTIIHFKEVLLVAESIKAWQTMKRKMEKPKLLPSLTLVKPQSRSFFLEDPDNALRIWTRYLGEGTWSKDIAMANDLI